MVAFALLTIGLLAPAVLASYTPLGYQSAVYHVPKGGRVDHKNDSVQVLSASGIVLNSTKSHSDLSPDAQVANVSNTNAFAFWRNNASFITSPISSLSTNWTVPPHPTSYTGQVLFLSSGVKSTFGGGYLLPTLQYGESAAGGGRHWSLVTWYAFEDIAFYTTPVKVSAGDKLEGTVRLNITSDTLYSYEASFANIVNTTFQLSLSPPLAFDVAEERVESSDITSPCEYPPHATVFSDINIRLLNNTIPSVNWIPNNNTKNGVTVSVDIDGAVNAKITVSYPDA